MNASLPVAYQSASAPQIEAHGWHAGFRRCHHTGYAQTTSGRILGTVEDQSGAIVPGATVTISDVQPGISRTLTVDEAGEYEPVAAGAATPQD
ncbi:MAG: carboxypeptidase-like regulatory domain-containing protein [Candidatus Acidiferrales bacterium]